MSKRPAFLVEGDMEQKFIQSVCPGVPVQKINCNGDDVKMSAIAKRVGTLGRLLQRRYSLLVVVFDRERRQESASDLVEEFLARLVDEEVDVEVVVGMPDRDIENWILADYASFANAAKLDRELIAPDYEGKKGKTELKKLLGDRPYVETVDGVTWLKGARPDVIAQNSPSFANLVGALRELQCWWLDQGSLRG